MRPHRLLGGLVAALAIAPAAGAAQVTAIAPPTVATQAAPIHPINPTDTGTTVVLTGKDLTIDEVVAIARRGAKVEYAPAARQRSLDAYNLLLEGTRQNIPIYFFNRGAGSGREIDIFEGDALHPDNEQLLKNRQLASFQRGARSGVGPVVKDEEIVRAMMVVRANTMVNEAATPALTQMLIDLINERVTPVVWSRGSPGEGDLPMMSNVGGTMVGVGDAYWKGEAMTAAEALQKAGLDVLEPFAADSAALVSSNAYSAGQAVLLLHEARRMLEWSELTFAISMLGLNSSVTPLTAVPQNARPFPYQNMQARRLLNLIRGSYLFDYEVEAGRIIQDPLSFRDYSQRSGALWEAYDRLKHNVLIQINSSDHNPAVVPGAAPSDSWELDTPWLRRYYVEPGPYSDKGGYILSNANFVAQPMANDLQAFSMAVAESLAGSVQRVMRFPDTFFTVITPADVLSAQVRAKAPSRGNSYAIADLMAELHTLTNPLPAQGLSLVRNVEDMESYTRQRVGRARQAVDIALRLTAEEMLSASYWVEVRKAQNPARSLGRAAEDALAGLRTVLPWQTDQRPYTPASEIVYSFMLNNPAANYTGNDAGIAIEP